MVISHAQMSIRRFNTNQVDSLFSILILFPFCQMEFGKMHFSAMNICASREKAVILHPLLAERNI